LSKHINAVVGAHGSHNVPEADEFQVILQAVEMDSGDGASGNLSTLLQPYFPRQWNLHQFGIKADFLYDARFPNPVGVANVLNRWVRHVLLSNIQL
jgi:hypothetical protein